MRQFGSAMAAAAIVGLMASLAMPQTAAAAIFGSSKPAEPESTLTFKSAAGTLTGKWAYRLIAISGDPKTSLSKMSLGASEFDLVEEGGKITGTRPAGKGKSYPVEGFVVYGARRAPQIVLHSTSDVNGKTYEFDYFAYLMPSWNVTATQPDTFMGTVVRTDPSAPDAPAIVVSFIATREAAAAPKPGK
ncbi:MAG TPA: hypothetical protein VHB23_05970 [Devosiaceae bacterium]|nr:hypothetical protein [Devosiaceae bacterium]